MKLSTDEISVLMESADYTSKEHYLVCIKYHSLLIFPIYLYYVSSLRTISALSRCLQNYIRIGNGEIILRIIAPQESIAHFPSKFTLRHQQESTIFDSQSMISEQSKEIKAWSPTKLVHKFLQLPLRRSELRLSTEFQAYRQESKRDPLGSSLICFSAADIIILCFFRQRKEVFLDPGIVLAISSLVIISPFISKIDHINII